MLSAPITRPSPGQSTRSFANRVLALMVCPHLTTVDAGAASAGTPTTDPPNVSSDADKPARKCTRIFTDPLRRPKPGQVAPQGLFYRTSPVGAIAIVRHVSM